MTALRRWVTDHLLYGRFLQFFGAGCAKDDSPATHWRLPSNLTERAFRRFWSATEAAADFRGHRANTEAAKKDEQRRFGEVVEALKDGILVRKKNVA
jgi:hypothetical protein